MSASFFADAQGSGVLCFCLLRSVESILANQEGDKKDSKKPLNQALCGRSVGEDLLEC